MPLSHDYLADYRALGCSPGCSLAELEQAWRSAMRVNHPDRARAGEEAAAALRAQELNTAFGRLREFYRRHGRLPGSTIEPPAGPGQSTSGCGPVAQEQAAGPLPGAARLADRRIGLRGLAVLALLAAVGIPMAIPPSARDGPDVAAIRPAPASEAVAQPAALFTLGSHRDDVRELAGEPLTRSGDPPRSETWEYGPSHVSFRAHRVIGWYSSPMYPLPVASERPDPTLIAPPSRR